MRRMPSANPLKNGRARTCLSVCAVTASACLMFGFAADESAKLLPDGPGKDAVAKVCSECHAMDNIRKLRLSRDDWSDKIGEMEDRGAEGSEAELSAVLDYLSRNFGPDSKAVVHRYRGAHRRDICFGTCEDAARLHEARVAAYGFGEPLKHAKTVASHLGQCPDGIVLAHDSAGSTGGARGDVPLFQQHDVLHAAAGQVKGYAGAIHSTADYDYLGNSCHQNSPILFG